MTPDLRDVVETSHTYKVTHSLGRRLRRITRPLRVARAGSRTASTLATVRRWIRASRLYGWLTADPDSQKIVIDLRQSSVVGPLLGPLEKGLGPLKRASVDARSTGLVRRVVARPATLIGAWFLGAVLASLVRAWPVSDPFVLGVYGFAICVSGLTLAVEDWRGAVANSRTSTLVASASGLWRGTR